MNWQEILTILVPILTLMGWVYNRIEKKSDERFKQINERFDKIDNRFQKIEDKLEVLNIRLTRLEGRFDERGYWESRIIRKNGTEEKE